MNAAKPDDFSSWSPTRSMLSILTGFVMNWFLLVLLGILVNRVFHAEVIIGGAARQSSTAKLLYIAVGSCMNAMISGMTTARIAQLAPFRHAVVLGSIFGFFVSAQLEQMRNEPIWFVAALVLGPVLGAAFGGLIVWRSIRRAQSLADGRLADGR